MISFKVKPGQKEFIFTKDHTEISRRSSTFSECTLNSFLIEIDNNSDIDENIRTEINTRYHKSIVNATYKFPRISYQPFPSISLQQKFAQKGVTNKRIFKKFIRSPIQLISHTPKPSLNKSVKISKRTKINRASPSPDTDIRNLSITPTPMTFSGKKKKMDFPKLRNAGVKTPTPFLSKPYRLTYK